MNQRVDIEVVQRLHQREQAEEDGGHWDGGQTGDPAEAVLDAGGGGGLGPGQGKVSSQYQVDDDDRLDRGLQTCGD